MQGLVLSSLRGRYSETDQIHVTDDDIGRLENQLIRGQVFDPSSYVVDPEVLGFDPASIVHDRSQWSSTTPDSFACKQQCLLLSLLQHGDSTWESLWLTILLRAHTLVRHDITKQYVYVIFVSDHLAMGWDLDHDGGRLHLILDVRRLRTVASCNSVADHDAHRSFSKIVRFFLGREYPSNLF